MLLADCVPVQLLRLAQHGVGLREIAFDGQKAAEIAESIG
jgi:hypothetical protein